MVTVCGGQGRREDEDVAVVAEADFREDGKILLLLALFPLLAMLLFPPPPPLLLLLLLLLLMMMTSGLLLLEDDASLLFTTPPSLFKGRDMRTDGEETPPAWPPAVAAAAEVAVVPLTFFPLMGDGDDADEETLFAISANFLEEPTERRLDVRDG